MIYLLSRQWFGLHPIGLACAAGKPVYCALPLADDLAELEALAKLVEQSGIVFMPEFARRCYPATLRLKELLATQLGPPRLVVGHTRLYGFDRYAIPGPTTQIAPAPLSIDPGSYLIDWCCFVFQSIPERITRVSVPGASHARSRRPGCRFREFRGHLSRRARRPRSRTAAITGHPGATRAASCRRRVPGLCRARGRLAGDAREDPVVEFRRNARKNDSRWSRPSATCSTTSSTAWSEAIIRSRRRFARPSKSHGWLTNLRRCQRERPAVARGTT